jgi:3-isopropylmalate/(R)-2-methylmalate dehydratase small subunit
MTVDLERQEVITPDGVAFGFHMPALQRELLLEGLDPIDHTLRREALISNFQERDAAKRPWVYEVPP